MINKFSLFIFFSFHLYASELVAGNISIDEIRKEYSLAMQDKIVCQKWFDLFEKHPEELEPVLEAYKGAIFMGMAKFAQVAKKVSYVNKGKAIIEAAILKDKNNVEIRFVRYSIQTKLPAVLNYNKNKEEDKNFITQHISSIKNEKFRTEIIKYLKENSAS